MATTWYDNPATLPDTGPLTQVLHALTTQLAGGVALQLILTRAARLDAQYGNRMYEGTITTPTGDRKLLGKSLNWQNQTPFKSADGAPYIKMCFDRKHGVGEDQATRADLLAEPMPPVTGIFPLFFNAADNTYRGALFTGIAQQPSIIFSGGRFIDPADKAPKVRLDLSLGNSVDDALNQLPEAERSDW